MASSSLSNNVSFLLFGCMIALSACRSPGNRPEGTSPGLDAIRIDLEKRMDSDQALRMKLPELQEKYGTDSDEVRALWDEQSAIDRENMARLEEIVAAHGWPGRSEVGEKGALAAFLILQHADHAFQKKYLPMVREAVARGELGADCLALLEDRVLMREGKPQIYGSQLIQNRKTGEFELYTIENEADVDARRAAVGLQPIEEYLKLFGLEYRPPAGMEPAPPH